MCHKIWIDFAIFGAASLNRRIACSEQNQLNAPVVTYHPGIISWFLLKCHLIWSRLSPAALRFLKVWMVLNKVLNIEWARQTVLCLLGVCTSSLKSGQRWVNVLQPVMFTRPLMQFMCVWGIAWCFQRLGGFCVSKKVKVAAPPPLREAVPASRLSLIPKSFSNHRLSQDDKWKQKNKLLPSAVTL